LATLLTILNANVPHKFMDVMFATDHTVSPNTINSIFRKHNADTHFRFRDFATAAANRNLTAGIAGLFTGLSGHNFSGQHGFTTDSRSVKAVKRESKCYAHTRKNLIHSREENQLWNNSFGTIEFCCEAALELT
jgi:hypothetical protein